MAATSRIVCVGANEISLRVLRGLIEIGADVAAVVTRPPASGRGICDFADLHPVCRDAGIATIDVDDINDESAVARVAAAQPDYLYTLGWSQLFNEPLCAAARHYVVGSHPSPLPAGRGRAPIPWTILQRQPRSAVTLFRIDQGVDAGPILSQKWFDVPPHINATGLYDLVGIHLTSAFCELYTAQKTGRIIDAVPQDPERASYRAKRIPSDGRVDFRASAADVDLLIRAVAPPYPGAYAHYEGERIMLWEASLDDVPHAVGAPGQVLERRGGRLLVQAGDRPLWINRWSWAAGFSSARQPRVGHRFGYDVEETLHHLLREMNALRTDRAAA